jgi:AAHS family 4-hydroxybenzoate transporter-like MFS transporter
VLSAALIGLAAGALIAGPVADRVGRKRVLIVSVMLFSLASLGSAFAHSVGALGVSRFLTGLGIGAAMPNCITLVSEFVPSKRRGFLVNLMFVGFPLGASVGGFVAAGLIPRYGWRSVFVVGGGTPLVLGLLLLLLPESVSFMAVRHWPVEKVKATLLRLFRGDAGARARIEGASGFYLEEPGPRGAGSAVGVLLAPELRFSTLMLWTAYFMGLLLYYLLTSWMPTLVRESGHTISDAARVTALFPLGGGIGALICGWLMDRVNATRVVCAAYTLTAILLVVLSRSTGAIGTLMALTFMAGIAMNGAQTSMPVLAAETYPTVGRASGVSWMLGVGRFGGILGALAGGVLLQAGYGMSTIILDLAIVALLAAAALLVKATVAPFF